MTISILQLARDRTVRLLAAAQHAQSITDPIVIELRRADAHMMRIASNFEAWESRQ